MPETAASRPLLSRLSYLRVGVYSLLVNLLLVAAKLTLAGLTGSLALRADGFHSLVDVFVSLALIIGLLLSCRKSPRFPYGLYKVENLVAAAIALLLFFTAYEVVAEAVRAPGTAAPYSGWALVAVAFLILIPFLFGRYELSVGRRLGSPSLMADGSQFTADVLGSAIVFLSLLGQRFGLPLDRVGAGLIALFIAYAAWGLLTGSMRVLLDASVSAETLNKIRAIIQAEPEVGNVESLAGRNSGRYIFVEASITVRGADLKKAHLATERIEQKIRDAFPSVERVSIHYEPEAKAWLRYAVPLAAPEGTLAEDFGQAPYFALVDLDSRTGALLLQEVVPNPHRGLGKGRGLMVVEFLLTYKPDVVISRESLAGKGPGYALAEAGAQVRQTEARTLEGRWRDFPGNIL